MRLSVVACVHEEDTNNKSNREVLLRSGKGEEQPSVFHEIFNPVTVILDTCHDQTHVTRASHC